MNSVAVRSAAVLATLCAAVPARAQYAPPPPPAPFSGFLNEWLRKQDPAWNKWDFSGSVRVRYEVKENYGIAGDSASMDFRQHGADVDNDFVMEKIRFRGSYTESWWSAVAEGRSSLVQSDERVASTGPVRRVGHGPEQDSIDLHQAYVTLGNAAQFPVTLKLGRQEMIYAEERIIGAFGWNNIGRVFDAARATVTNEWFVADLFASRVVIPEDERFNVANDYDWFSGVYATSGRVPRHQLDFFLLSRNASAQAATAEPSPQAPLPSARDIYTVGARLKSAPGQFGNWDYALDAMGQFGNYTDTRSGAPAGRLEHRAYAVVAQGGYTFKDAWATPRLGLEYAHGSGDNDPQDDQHGTFENLFPTNHKFYGYMDLFSLQNVHDVRLIYQVKPHPRASFALEAHAFWLADTQDSFYTAAGTPRGGAAATPGTGYGVNPDYNNFVGTEIDLVAGFALTRQAQLEAGVGHFFTGKYIDSSLSAPGYGSEDASFIYLQMTLRF
jgi:hypothetical protein